MTTTYQTIPTEPTTASAKSRKGLVFGVAAAAFLLNTTPSDGTPCFDASCGVHVKGVDC